LLSDRTVEKNLKFVLEATGWSDKTKMEDRINEVLGSVNMKSKKHKMPHELSGENNSVLPSQEHFLIIRILFLRMSLQETLTLKLPMKL
jgi:ABC-type lipopolysaccharide export system ATPase subunit